MSIKDVVAKYKREASKLMIERVMDDLAAYEKMQEQYLHLQERIRGYQKQQTLISDNFAKELARLLHMDEEDISVDLMIDLRGIRGDLESFGVIEISKDAISPDKVQVLEDRLSEMFGIGMSYDRDYLREFDEYVFHLPGYTT